MTKAVVLIGLLFSAAACDVGSVPAGVGGGGVDAAGGGSGGGGGGGDGGNLGSGSGSGSGSGAAISPNVCVARATATAPHLHGDGSSHAGQACMTGCHGDGTGGAPLFQLSGTVYKTDGVTGNPGANVAIFPTAGGAGHLADNLDTDGNFYVYKGTIPGAFPSKTVVSACPSITPMTDTLQANGGGDCNSCHKAGGAAGAVITLADQ